MLNAINAGLPCTAAKIVNIMPPAGQMIALFQEQNMWATGQQIIFAKNLAYLASLLPILLKSQKINLMSCLVNASFGYLPTAMYLWIMKIYRNCFVRYVNDRTRLKMDIFKNKLAGIGAKKYDSLF